MNVALIIAGGVGSRMGLDVPKQFVTISGKPVLIYTMECFEHHPMVDCIELVCLDGWQETARKYAEKFGITKLHRIVTGGASGQESIRNGVFALRDACNDDDIVIIHDGIRPLVDDSVLSDVIVKCEKYGNAVTSLPYNEQIFVADDDFSTTKYIPRETLRRVSTPQAYKFGLLYEKYQEAFSKGIGIHGSAYTNTMMADLGVRLFFAAGSDRNIKLTTKDDLELFKAYINSNERTR